MSLFTFREQETILEFAGRQLIEVQKGGWPTLKLKLTVFTRLVIKVMVLIALSPLSIVPVIVMRLIRPWLLIRVGELESKGIGHFSLPIEIYLSEVECGLHNFGKKSFDIWYLNSIVCNKVLEDKWRRIFRVWPWQIMNPIDGLNRLIPGGMAHVIPFRYLTDRHTPWQNVDIHGVLDRTTPHLLFSPDEVVVGTFALRTMGISENDPIVCVSVRDGAYYNEKDLRFKHRNSSLQLLVPAMENLAGLGFKVIRMGAKVSEKLPTSNVSVIDYATNGMRSELLDLFLIARCRFMVSTGTGVDALAPTFRRPLVYVNLGQFGFVDEQRSVLFIPKHFWSISEKRMLTFPEIFKIGAHLFTLQEHYAMAGIESVENTSDEISAAVSEMERRLSGDWITQPEDEVLQRRFLSIWPVRKTSMVLQARIGTEFLRQHPEMLG